MNLPCSVPKLIFNGIVSALFLFLGVYAGILRFVGLCICFLVLGIIFLIITIIYAPVVTLSERGISMKLFGHTLHDLTWEDVKEVSIIGTNVSARSSRSSGTGSTFFCFFPEEMTEEKRFSIALRWPPRNCIFLHYTEKNLAAVRQYYSGPFTSCNTGKLILPE